MTDNNQIAEAYKQQRQDRPLPMSEPVPISEVVPEVKRDIKFSIVFPTRERRTLLQLLLESVKDNTSDISCVEVLIATDDDDATDYAFLKDYAFVQRFVVKRSLNFSHDYYNFLAVKTIGRWIITGNDDMRVETKSWDVIAFNTLKDLPSVIYGWIEDGLDGFRVRGGGSYCCFPLQGRGGYEALGYVFPGRVPTWGADILLGSLYTKVNSVVKIPIMFRHYCYHNGTREQDHVNKRISQNQVMYSVRPTRQEIEVLIKALNGTTMNKRQMDDHIDRVMVHEVTPSWIPANTFRQPHQRRRLTMNS